MKKPTPIIYCNNRPIGKGFPPFIIAEAGVHHNCSLPTAFSLVDEAVASGADAIKFQTYKADKLVTTWAARYWDCGEKQGTQFDTFKQRDKFNFNDYKAIAEYCKEKGIVFLSTPFDEQSVEWMRALDIPLYKIASADLTHYPLLKKIADTGKPILLSTGASDHTEINEAIKFLHSCGASQIALLHCSLCYPTPNDHANLRRITGLQKQFPECVIGYSDHTIPDETVSVLISAVALGADIIETHFTLDRSLPEDDHYHALDAKLLRRLVDASGIVYAALGVSEIRIDECEIPARLNARRSIVAAQRILAGTVISEDLLAYKRPGTGISPNKLRTVLGKRVIEDIPADGLVLLDNLR